MKKLTLFLLVTLLILVAFAALFFAGGTLGAELSAVTAPASDYPQVFESIAGVLAADAAPQLFTADLPGEISPEGLTLEDVTLTLSNRGIFDAEWLSVEALPVPGDIAVYSLTGEGSTIRARSVGTVNLKLLSRGTPAGRKYRIEYYVYGLKRSVTVSP